MEIVITHTIHPDVMAFFKSLVPAAPSVNGKEIAAPSEAKASPKPAQKASTPKAEVKEASESPAPETTTKAPEVQFTDIRQAYLQKKEEGKQDKVKAILDEYGIEKLSALKPEFFTEVLAKIKAL